MADTVEQNKAHFNKLADEYDSKHGQTLERLLEHIRSMKDFIGADWVNDEDGEDNKAVRLLDYACGTGMVSRALGPWVSRAVGIDVTENMVAIYNSHADNQGLSPSEMHAHLGNLCDESSPSPEVFSSPTFFNFDVAAVGLGFHHFLNPSFAAKQLAARLRPSGVLFIIDFLPHADLTHGHAAKHTITQHGFGEEEIRGIFEDAGCGVDFGLREMGEGVVFDGMGKEGKKVTRRVFLARGTKAVGDGEGK